MHGESINDNSLRSDRFATTCWTMVVTAGQEDSPATRRAMESLCKRYWSPLYLYLRRWGHDESQAEDLVQGFFAHLLEKDGLQTVKRQKHRFRSFLLASLKNFAVDQWRLAQRGRRGSDQRTVPLEFERAETRYCLESAGRLSADKLFNRAWALAIIERALEMIRREYIDAGKSELFEQLKDHITIEPLTNSYRKSADHLGMSKGAVRVATHRLRRRLRELIRSEIAETVTTAEQFEEEIQDLFAAFEP
jgi:RNA polymerase sigma factor (sigma-70 family)